MRWQGDFKVNVLSVEESYTAVRQNQCSDSDSNIFRKIEK